MSILVELGSTNLNFSSEATASLVTYLAVQAGPAHGTDEPYRALHGIFRDETFGEALANQLSSRLDTMVSNWREVYLMELVISLALRLFELAVSREKAAQLILRARSICLKWVRILRGETFRSKTIEAAQRLQRYTLRAALLCRRTFEICRGCSIINVDDLAAYIEASISVNDNLTSELDGLPEPLQYAIARDLKLAFDLDHSVITSMLSQPNGLLLALSEIWPDAGDDERRIGGPITPFSGSWITCSTPPTSERIGQRIKYNHIQGILLIDDHPISVSSMPSLICVVSLLETVFQNTTPLPRRNCN